MEDRMDSTCCSADLPDVEIPPRADLIMCLTAGLHFLRGETPEQAQRLARRLLANIIIEHLHVAGYTIIRRPPSKDREV